jgi:hypothetical protein
MPTERAETTEALVLEGGRAGITPRSNSFYQGQSMNKDYTS